MTKDVKEFVAIVLGIVVILGIIIITVTYMLTHEDVLDKPEPTMEQKVHQAFLECLEQHAKTKCWIDERYNSPECEEYARTLHGLKYKDRETDRSLKAVNKVKAKYKKDTTLR